MTQLIAGVSAVALALFVWLQSRGFPGLPEGQPGPGLFPRVIAIGLFAAGCVLAVQGLLQLREERAEMGDRGFSAPGILRVGVMALFVGLYPLASDLLGFIPTISVLCFVAALLMRARALPGALTAVGGTVVIYVLFTRILGVPL